ncbi:MAG: hypothetical protein CMF22_11670 [Idiomarinaceae bacterium]|nr:hypothetical protein [Idiomarinaceae bacterium]|tara:strand:- start:59188 stop:60396 length:1209 start_codon:yes stop_codon:yes gene_type:complete
MNKTEADYAAQILTTPNEFFAYAMSKLAEGIPKAVIARILMVSPRTVGRMVERVESIVGTGALVSVEDFKKAHTAMKSKFDSGWTPWNLLSEKIGREGYKVKWTKSDPSETVEEPLWTKAEPLSEEESLPVEKVTEDTTEEDATYTFVLTSRSLVITRHPDGTERPESITILPSDKAFQDACAELMIIATMGEDPEAEQRELKALFKKHSKVERLKEINLGKVHVDFEKGVVMVKLSDGSTVPASGGVVTRILEEEGDRLVKFLDNLYENPSYTAITGLFDFLEATDIQIDDEGYVIAMKVITHDYLDKHTRTMDNSVGTTVKMDRRLVDDNPDSLCSSGLHACSESYIEGFRSGNDRLVKVRIHPKDFVSVPKAYTRTVEGGSVASKARVCEYVVIEEVKD